MSRVPQELDNGSWRVVDWCDDRGYHEMGSGVDADPD